MKLIPRDIRRRTGTTLALLGVLAVVAAVPGAALAARAHHGNLAVSFDASFAPSKLPRHRLAPVSVSFSGAVRTDDGSPLPRLRRLQLGLAAGSRLDVGGLPICPLSRLGNATANQAMRSCPGALVGRGSLTAEIDLPQQAPFSSQAELLAFNGRDAAGRPAVWVQAYSTAPPASFVLPFSIRPHSGTFATALTAKVPSSLGPWPRLSAFQITLQRRYRYRGAVHSYLSASCPVPPRFTGGLLPFARASYFFAAGGPLTATVARACQVS